jgi:hypothetical protein
MIFSRAFKTKEERQHYIDVCATIWGCVPVDVDWAMQTPIWKNESNKR